MRSLRSAVGIVSAIVVLAGASTAQARSDHHGHGSFHTIKLWATETQSNFVDLGDPGSTLGDRDVFTDDVSRKPGGKVIGFDGGECTLVRIDEPAYAQTFQC